MGATSTASKRKYNDKTYKRWTVDLRFEDYDRIEQARGELSRSQFLKKLFEIYEKSQEKSSNVPTN